MNTATNIQAFLFIITTPATENSRGSILFSIRFKPDWKDKQY